MLVLNHNAVKYLSSIFPELANYQIQSFYPSYFGARERLQRELGCPVSDILVLAYLALEDIKPQHILRRLKEVQIIEREYNNIIDLSRVREIIREEETEINKIKISISLFSW